MAGISKGPTVSPTASVSQPSPGSVNIGPGISNTAGAILGQILMTEAGAAMQSEAAVSLQTEGTAPVINPPAPFDWYIGPNGNDANPGTVASPWSIRSLISNSANNAKMAAKRVGFLPGTYNVAGTAGVAGATLIGHGSFPANGSFCALSVPPGTPTASTFIGSSDANGLYSPRLAIIHLVSGQQSSANNKWNNAIIGRDQTSNAGYVTIDGLVIQGNNMDCIGPNGNEGAHIIFFQSTDGSFTAAGTMAKIVVQNCDVGGINATDNGGNDACIWFQGCTGAIAQFNYIHDTNKSNDISHCHGLEAYGCTGGKWNNNTFVNHTGGAMEPKEGCGGIEAAYNYCYNCAFPTGSADNRAVFQAWDGQEGRPNTPNLPYSIHHNIVDSCGRVTYGESGNNNHAMNLSWYNNVVYDTRASVGSGDVTNQATGVVLQSINSAVISHYNNIYVIKNSAVIANYAWFTAGFVSSLGFDVVYGPSISNYSGAFVNGAPGLTVDPKFAPGTSNLVAGGGPTQFKLALGSPCLGSGLGGVDRGAWQAAVSIGCGFGPYA